MRAPIWPGPRRIAHRGGGTLAPENTLAAIRTGIAHGYRGVEFDVMLTADDVPVLMHDPAFGRTIAGQGSVATSSYAELATRDAGAWFGPGHVGEAVPRYDDVLRFCVANDVWMNVEIKPSPGRDGVTGRVVGQCSSRGVAGDVGAPGAVLLFSSFSVDALAAARGAAPEIPRGLLVDALARRTIDAALGLGCASVHVDHRALRREAVDRLHAAGLAVMAFTVDDARRVALLEEWGVDAVCTDRIDVVRP